MSWRAGALEATAAASAVFALGSQWVWTRMFSSMFPALTIGVALTLVCVVVFVVTLTLLRWQPPAVTLVRFVLAFGALAFTYAFVRMHLTLVPFPAATKLGIAAATAIAAALMATRMGAETWQRVDHAIIGAGLALTLSFPIVARLQAAPPAGVFALEFLGPTGQRPKATAIIVLDEASPELMAPVIDAMRVAGVTVHARDIQAAGPNTLNVMPAMLTGRRFEGMLPCWRDVLCADGGNVRFASLRPHTANVDVIGYYLPYCAIPGLRSCEAIPYWGDERILAAAYDLACGHLLRYLRCEDGMSRIDAAVTGGRVSRWIRNAEPYRGDWRETLRVQLDRVPFWSDGGVLIAHVPLPHLPARLPSGDLKRDYAANINEAALLLGGVTQRLKRVYGDDFVLVVTADHPLRVEIACSRDEYRGQPECGRDLPRNAGRVPFIVASPQGRWFESVATNMGLLK